MDISIKNLKSYIFDPKTEALRLARAQEITSKKLVVTEKVDGTKLTLVRTNTEDADYEKNWIVAYKGTVLHAAEFAHIKDKAAVTQKSVGIGQYALVFDHLKTINKNISNIPKSYEFSVEFAQNKDTLTRTYVQKGGMFLRSYAPVEYRIIQGDLHTNTTGPEETEQIKLIEMAKKLQISAFPVFYRGKITQTDLKKSAAIYNHIEAQGVNWNNPIDVVEKFSNTVLEIPSTLGGKTEGVVLKTEDGNFFKIVQSDQYSSDVRGAKKDIYRMDPEKTTIYFQQIRKLLNEMLANIKSEDPKDIFKQVIHKVSELPDSALPKHEKKTPLQVRDDIHETLRLLVSKSGLLGQNINSIGLLPIAGKPLHLGHWKLILKAAEENNRVVIYTSEKDRVKKGEFPIYGKDFIRFWSDIFIPHLPKNVRVKVVDSPVRAVQHELSWFEQTFVQDQMEPPIINIYSDQKDAEDNFSPAELNKYPTINKLGKIHVVGVERTTTVNISGTKMREFLQQNDKNSFLKYLPPISPGEKEKIWNTLMKHKPENPIKEFINELISRVYGELILESGASIAMVDPKTPKTVNGEEARAAVKLSIVDKQGKDIHNQVSDDIKEMVLALNNKVGFWKQNNPYIYNGHIFNGSSQFLMDPKKRGELIGVKNTFGDIDVIIPKTKLKPLEVFLDSIDDNQAKWKKTPKNSLTTKFQYVGRTKSYAAIPDQLVTIWYYQPAGHVVQIDFEGDDMVIDPQGFEKPSEMTKFTKDSPWEDLKVGIKGLAGALMLRALTRGTSRLDNAVVLTGRGLKNVMAGATDLKDSDVSHMEQHTMPSRYTFNPGGSGIGMREAYKFIKQVNYKGKPVNAYRFIEAKETRLEDRITDIGRIFEIIFKRKPTTEDKAQFRSFQGQLRMIKKYIDKDTTKYIMQRFADNLNIANIDPSEREPISKAAKNILGYTI